MKELEDLQTKVGHDDSYTGLQEVRRSPKSPKGASLFFTLI